MAENTFRILLLGDFHFGESYSQAGARVLESRGYEHSLKYLWPFTQEADAFIVNFESPIVDPHRTSSPLVGKKTYVHWADPEKTPQALKALGVDAVSLANNHTVDHGAEGLLKSFEHLENMGIPWFGAGKNIKEARTPYSLNLPENVGGGQIHFHSFFQYSKTHDHKFKFYADNSTPGCAPINSRLVTDVLLAEHRPDIYNVAFPHWGANYQWRSTSQSRIGDALLERGFDLVIGHGSHCLQQLERRKQRWVAYSIGNGNFQSGGRFTRYVQRNGILPMGAWAMLHVELHGGKRELQLRLYPVYSDNRETDFQPKPVTETDFMHVRQRLQEESDKGRFSNSHCDYGKDELGWYIRTELGEWPLKQSPSRLRIPRRRPERNPGQGVEQSLPDRAAPGIYSDSHSLYIRDQQINRNKNVAPLLISSVAEKQGATTTWINSRVAVINFRGLRMMLQGHRGSESAVGKALISDKYLSKRLLLKAGVSTPRGDLARTADDAVAIRRQYDAPVVVKPRFGLKGIGVSVNLTTDEEIIAAFHRANTVTGGVVIEEYIEGDGEYRCLTTPDECVSVVHRLLPNVTGDGSSTILELITRKNEQRTHNPSTYKRPTPIDAVTEAYLLRNGLSYDHVPKVGENLTVRDVGGLSSGGEPHECSDVINDDVKSMATQAASAIPGLSWAGADVMTAKGTGRPYVIEINSDADIAGASFPFYGEPVNVAGKMWRIRVERAAPPINTPVVVHTSLDSPVYVPGMKSANGNRAEGIRLSSLVGLFLREKGYEVHEESPTLSRVVDSHGKERWLNGCVNTEDLAIVNEIVKRHRLVRKLLADAGLPRVRSTRAKNYRAFETFVNTAKGGLAILPYRHSWDGPRVRHFANAAEVSPDLFKSQRDWIVQGRPEGQHFRIAASPNEVLVVLSASAAVESTVNLVSRRAVEAVRAVPELRWGFVDVIIRNRQPVIALIEGLSLNPLIAPDLRIIAGSWRRLIDQILVR